jgi:hypothetical protein
LQTIFDKLDYTQRLYGKIRLQAIRKNFSKGKVEAILGKESDPRFFSSHSLKYSVCVEEGNYSTSQRQMELQQLLHFRELQIPIANKSIINAAFITNKAQVIQDMQEEQQAQAQQAQQQAQMEAQSANADVMLQFAKAKESLAKEKDLLASAQEKLAKVEELHSESEHKKTEADLNLVKMMIELEDMDFNNFKNSFEMAQAIKMGNESSVNKTQAKEA